MQGYNVFDSPGRPSQGDKRTKWGVSLGVRRDLSATLVSLPADNAILHSLETSTSTMALHLSDSRMAYTAFLTQANGRDVWQSHSFGNALQAHTYTSPQGDRGVIDRAAHSSRGILTADITVPRKFVPATDHRPFLASFLLLAPDGHTRSSLSRTTDASTSSAPRYRYPRTDATAIFGSFEEVVGERLATFDVDLAAPILSDDVFESRYHALTSAMHDASAASFPLPRLPTRHARVSSPEIRPLVIQLHRLKLISAIKSPQERSLELLAVKGPWVRDYLDAFGLPRPSLIRDKCAAHCLQVTIQSGA